MDRLRPERGTLCIIPSFPERSPILQRSSLFATVFALGSGATLAFASLALRREAPAVGAARQFLATLEPDQSRKARYSYDHEERLNWNFVPIKRNGLNFGEMKPEQHKAALTLLRVGVSAEGVTRLETLRQLENVLKEIERGSGPVRDPDLYFITVFGEPSERGAWGWRYEGHHVSLQWSVRDGKIVADTPQFLGANPAEVREGAMKGTRLLAKEEDEGFALVKSLDENQRKEGLTSTTAPNEILTGNSRQAQIQRDSGVPYLHLKTDQKKKLEALILQHSSLQPSELARKRLSLIRRSGLDKVKFAWMGGLEKGQGHYYRIQGTTFLIEFDNTQNNANHIHTVWRDFKGDFGADLLAQHARTSVLPR